MLRRWSKEEYVHINSGQDEGWLVLELQGDATTEPSETWRELRSSIARGESHWVIVDVTELTGVSDRFVETLIGIAADAHHRGGALALVGRNEETRRRFGALHAADFVTAVETIQQAKDTLEGPEAGG